MKLSTISALCASFLFTVVGCAAKTTPESDTEGTGAAQTGQQDRQAPGRTHTGNGETAPPADTASIANLAGVTARYISREGSDAKSLLVRLQENSVTCDAHPENGETYYEFVVAGATVVAGSVDLTNDGAKASGYRLVSAGNGAVSNVVVATSGTLDVSDVAADHLSGDVRLAFGDGNFDTPFKARWCPDQLDQRAP